LADAAIAAVTPAHAAAAKNALGVALMIEAFMGLPPPQLH
jgi:hypothetical protein